MLDCKRRDHVGSDRKERASIRFLHSAFEKTELQEQVLQNGVVSLSRSCIRSSAWWLCGRPVICNFSGPLDIVRLTVVHFFDDYIWFLNKSIFI